MAPRNLTSQSPNLRNSISDENQNSDFSDDNSNPFETASNELSDINQATLNHKLLYPDDSVSKMNPFSSLNSLSIPADGRYLNRGSVSFQESTASFCSISPSDQSNTSHQVQSDSEPLINTSESNPFLVDTDFSPFGGYPTTSFPLFIDETEEDDYLHNPDPINDMKYENNRILYDLKTLDKRSATTLMGVIIFLLGGGALFVVLPVLTYTGTLEKSTTTSTNSTSETYEVLSDYVYPMLSSIRTDLVDEDTPSEFHTREARDGSLWKLVFSDEFAAEGRTFYDGDDQFWYAPDLNYDATKDLEWYDPDAVTTSAGTLNLRMDAYKNHDLYYRSGMLHSWNRMCFTQGIMEVSAKLPNYGNITGLWPGLWAMGNLGRPGYMATTDGVWPYSYDACDAGITPNQSSPDGINYLLGQKLNSCTCKGEDHPNRGTGRGAPEIDIIEGEVDTNIRVGVASQSMQLAPMDIWYIPDYNFIEIHNNSITTMNTYTGGPYQQALSATTTMNTSWYQFGDNAGYFQKYAHEYLNDDTDGYSRWFIGDNPTFTVHANALAPNGNIDWRRISKEPMSLILNLGISNNWAYIDYPSIDFPVTFEIDYVRIYQPNDSVSVTCDPDDYPTYDYIEDHPLAYDIWNYTTWNATGYDFPLNNLTGGCT